MPRYVVTTRGDWGGTRLHYTADSSQLAEEMAKGDGFEVLSVAEDVPPLPSLTDYTLLLLAGRIITTCGVVMAIIGVIMGLAAVGESKSVVWYGWSVALSGVVAIGIGQSMVALREIAISSRTAANAHQPAAN